MAKLADSTRQLLAWYVLNCANSATAGGLEPILLKRLNCLNGTKNGEEYLDLSTAKSRRPLTRKLRQVLRKFSAPPKSKESLEQNVFYARDEFDLDDVDTEILLLAKSHETLTPPLRSPRALISLGKIEIGGVILRVQP